MSGVIHRPYGVPMCPVEKCTHIADSYASIGEQRIKVCGDHAALIEHDPHPWLIIAPPNEPMTIRYAP